MSYLEPKNVIMHKCRNLRLEIEYFKQKNSREHKAKKWDSKISKNFWIVRFRIHIPIKST